MQFRRFAVQQRMKLERRRLSRRERLQPAEGLKNVVVGRHCGRSACSEAVERRTADIDVRRPTSRDMRLLTHAPTVLGRLVASGGRLQRVTEGSKSTAARCRCGVHARGAVLDRALAERHGSGDGLTSTRVESTRRGAVCALGRVRSITATVRPRLGVAQELGRASADLSSCAIARAERSLRSLLGALGVGGRWSRRLGTERTAWVDWRTATRDVLEL